MSSTVLLIVLVATVGLASANNSVWRYNRCPAECDCAVRFSSRFQANLRTVDCANRGFTAFPKPETIPSDAQILMLTDNRITKISDHLRLWLPDLLQLDLSHNRIAAVQNRRGFFDGLYSLQHLDLSDNRLVNLKRYAFQGLFNLQELNLSHNRLSAIMDDAFSGLSKLETLDLSANRLTYIQNNWWRHIPSLYYLRINHNLLRMVQNGAFQPLNHLISLDLSHNQIFQVNDQAFIGLDSLHSLQLNNNALSSVPTSALEKIKTTLSTIDLSQNPMFRLSAGDFPELSELREIGLAKMNRLRVVESGSFTGLQNLLVIKLHDCPYLAYLDPHAFIKTEAVTHLYLHNNNLTVLEKNTVNSLPKLLELSFYGNPLSCDCNARWLRKMMAVDTGSQPNLIKESQRIVCNSPAEHKFKLFMSLSEDALPYECPPRIIHLFSDQNTRIEGEDIAYDCRAVGTPTPVIGWVTPDGRPIVPSTYHSRRVLTNGGQTLVLRGVTASDSGLYTCIARSELGAAAIQTSLSVTPIAIQLHVDQVASTSATLSWDGEDRQTAVFQVLFRRVGAAFRHQYAGTVTPTMTTYRIDRLRPATEYEACIALENDEHVVAHISCVRFVTLKHDDGALFGLLVRHPHRNVLTAAVAGVLLSVAAVTLLMAVAVWRRPTAPRNTAVFTDFGSLEAGLSNRKHLLEQSYTSDGSASTLTRQSSVDNIYSPLVAVS